MNRRHYVGVIDFKKVITKNANVDIGPRGHSPIIQTAKTTFKRYAVDAQKYTAALLEAFRFKRAVTAFQVTSALKNHLKTNQVKTVSVIGVAA